MEPVCQIITPVGMLGYGFDEHEFQAALKKLSAKNIPTAIILDSGSTDSGPTKLASGSMSCPRSSYVRDLAKLLRGVTKYKFPLLVGSCGGAGLNSHVDDLEQAVKEIAEENSYKLKVLKIHADIPKDLVCSRLNDGRITGCGAAVPQLTQTDIDQCNVVTSQMGVEPFYAAMEQCPDFDVVLAGRTYDPEPYFAYATKCLERHNPQYKDDIDFRQRAEGSIMHLGKLLECGGQCAAPKSAGIVAKVYSDATFETVPTDPNAKCTPTSVAAHTLYEKSRPDILPGPGGWLDLTESKYKQLKDGRTVRAWGGRYLKSVEQGLPYQIKLEGARNVAHRSMFIGSIKDPVLITEIDNLLQRTKRYARYQHEQLKDDEIDLDFHVYGRGTSEIVIVGEALGPTQTLATSIASSARIATIHGPYAGQKATSGNFAFGVAGTTEVPLGLCSEFCVYHLMELDAGEETSLYRVGYSEFDFAPKTNGVKHEVNGTRTNGEVAAGPEATKTPASWKSPMKASVVDPHTAVTLGDAAKVLRSKNSGPYELTLDILFDRQEIFDIIKAAGFLTTEVVADLYGLRPDQVLWCGYFDQALGFKATLPRMRNGKPTASGGFMEGDVHASQNYVQMMNLELPKEVREKLAALP